ncbi:MAG: hypothetical protein MUC88_09010 [Planctomycetes bacterium]|jgi:hypothetical protein|nr:hypothetical protein [Planctomycetota bacterium]
MDRSPHSAAHPDEPCRPGGPERSSYGEPAALRVLGLLWTSRWLVTGGALLPALLVALALYAWPSRYTATFVYERPLQESEFNVLQRRFYSQENLEKIVTRLREQKLTHYVRRLERARQRQSFERLIRFDVDPMYPRRLLTTDPCTSERISAFRARLLSLEIVGKSEAEVSGVAAVVTDNIERVLPLYDIRNHLKKSLEQIRGSAAETEDRRFDLTLDLGREVAKLEKLKALDSAGGPSQDNVVLQFNSPDQSREVLPLFSPGRTTPEKLAELQKVLRDTEKYNFYDFLPVSYQVRAVQSRIVDLQETLANDTERHNFHLQVLDLDNQLLTKIEESLLLPYTASQYLGYLNEQLQACQDQAVRDHLRAHVRQIESLVALNTRAGERPIVHPISRNPVRNGVLTLVLCLMVTTFAAVVLECRREGRPALASPGRPGSQAEAAPRGLTAADRSPG